MKKKILSLGLFFTLTASMGCSGAGSRKDSAGHGHDSPQQSNAASAQKAEHAHGAREARRGADPHNLGVTPGVVPAYVTDPKSLKNLPPTLPPENFTGRRREGYAAVRAIPETIAQLPCYCHCDRGFGHKSLHSCFVDDHGANCSICLEEALLAYRLEKEEGLKPEQIRQRIIEQYGGR